MTRLEQLILEYRAGRVLSAKNEAKLREAMQAMMDVLGQLGMDEEDSERSGRPWQEQRTVTITGIELRAREGKLLPTIAGHAALFNVKSVFMYGFKETILPGAFAESLKANDIRKLWQHDTTQVLGRTGNGTLRLWEDDQGLAFENDPPDTQAGRDAVTLIDRGDVDQESFGFNVPPNGVTWAEDEDGIPLRQLRTVSLMEISPVTWAAYPQTGVGVVRNAPEWVQRALTHGVDDSSKAEGIARARFEILSRELDLLAL